MMRKSVEAWMRGCGDKRARQVEGVEGVKAIMRISGNARND